MPGRDVFSTVKTKTDIDPVTEIATLTIRDEFTQRDYEVVLPLHLLPIVSSMIERSFRDRPDLAARYLASHIRRG